MYAAITKNILNNNLLLTTAVLVGVLFAAIFMGTAEVAASTESSVREGITATGAPAGTNVNALVARIVDILSWIVGIIAVIMIIIGGLKYITSTGDSQKIDSAKNTILYAIIGLVVVVFAQLIVLFVLNEATAPTTPPTP